MSPSRTLLTTALEPNETVYCSLKSLVADLNLTTTLALVGVALESTVADTLSLAHSPSAIWFVNWTPLILRKYCVVCFVYWTAIGPNRAICPVPEEGSYSRFKCSSRVKVLKSGVGLISWERGKVRFLYSKVNS